MLDPENSPESATEPPAWLDGHALKALMETRARSFTWGRDALAAREAMEEAALARWPSLPLTMIAEAVAAVVPDAEGLSRASRGRAVDPRAALVPAERQEVAEVRSYALRFNAEGRPRRAGYECLAPFAAAQLVEHLRRANPVVMHRPSPRTRWRPRRRLSGWAPRSA